MWSPVATVTVRDRASSSTNRSNSGTGSESPQTESHSMQNDYRNVINYYVILITWGKGKSEGCGKLGFEIHYLDRCLVRCTCLLSLVWRTKTHTLVALHRPGNSHTPTPTGGQQRHSTIIRNTRWPVLMCARMKISDLTKIWWPILWRRKRLILVFPPLNGSGPLHLK